MKKVLLIDNHDSFTYNIVHVVEEILGHEISVKKNDEVGIEDIDYFDFLIISPGPGLPSEAGLLLDIIEKYKSSKNIFGICLGLQAISECYGSSLKKLDTVYHGIESEIEVTYSSSKIYEGLPDTFSAGRYHSWVIDETTLPDGLVVTSRESNGHIMSIEHQTDKVYAVQFHPESIMTPLGKEILKNFLSL